MKKKILIGIIAIILVILLGLTLKNIRSNNRKYKDKLDSFRNTLHNSTNSVIYQLEEKEDTLLHYTTSDFDAIFDKKGNLVDIYRIKHKLMFNKTPNEGDIKEYMTDMNTRIPNTKEELEYLDSLGHK